MVQDGYVTVPDAPGLGIELNEDAIKEHLIRSPDQQAAYPAGAFESTEEWDGLDSHDRTWS